MSLPPVPYQTDVTDETKKLTPVWADFFKQLFARSGGGVANKFDWQSSIGSGGYQTLPGGINGERSRLPAERPIDHTCRSNLLNKAMLVPQHHV